MASENYLKLFSLLFVRCFYTKTTSAETLGFRQTVGAGERLEQSHTFLAFVYSRSQLFSIWACFFHTPISVLSILYTILSVVALSGVLFGVTIVKLERKVDILMALHFNYIQCCPSGAVNSARVGTV